MTEQSQANDDLAPIREMIQRQPWFQKFSKSLAAAIGAIINLVWLGLSLGIHLPDGVEKWGFVLLAGLTTFGVYQVPSGITQSQFKQIQTEYYVGKHRKD